MKSLFENLKVIDLASFIAGPCAATLLADYGADVLKIEPPGGDGLRRLHGKHPVDYYWQLTSRGKRGMALDISNHLGREVLHRLLVETDVLVLNFRDSQLRRYGLELETLKARYPKLILARVTGFGSKGSEKDKPGYDTTVWWARSGIMQLMKPAGGTPVFPAGGVGDHSTGMALFASIVMALYRRQSTGFGSIVETSLIENGVWANGLAMQATIAGRDVEENVRKSGSPSPFNNVFNTSDHHTIILTMTNPSRDWPLLAKALNHPEWLDDHRFSDRSTIMKNSDDFREVTSKAFSSLSLSEVVASLESCQLAYGVVKRPVDVVNDAHLQESGFFVSTNLDDPLYQKAIPSPIHIDGEIQRPPGNPPEFGEHTEEILQELGYTSSNIQNLLDEQAVFFTPASNSAN